MLKFKTEIYVLFVSAELDLLLDRINDLIKYRIESVLTDMSKTKLVELPVDQPQSISDFVDTTRVSSFLYCLYFLQFLNNYFTFAFYLTFTTVFTKFQPSLKVKKKFKIVANPRY